MKLFRSYTRTCIKTARKNNMRVRVLGDPTALAEDLQASLKELEESSKEQYRTAVPDCHQLRQPG